MLQNHLKIALRNMTRQRGFALINLAGLTIGLTVCFLIFMWVSEVGIRKVLGASIPDIIAMLSKDFLVLVFIATLIAFPLAWWGMSNWLENFAYRTDLNWWIFAIAGLAMIVIALLTVASQAIKAAFTNPIESLRDE